MAVTIEQIRMAISKACPEKPLGSIPDDGILKDLGFDSLDRFNVLLEVETQTGVSIPDEDVASLSSIRNIFEYVASRGK